MRIPRLQAGPWVAAAGVIAAAAILFTILHQGNATANTGPPDAPANTLAHLIVPDGEEPRIRVSWDGSDTGATGYTITRGDGQAFEADGTETTFSDHSVEPGTAYSYAVTAQNGQGDSPASMAASASVADTPSAPGSLSAAVAELTAADETASVTLTWTASSVPPVEQCDIAYPLDGYTISRSDGTDEVELGTTGADVTSFTDPNAGFSNGYTYRVAARNAIGTSPAAEATATIPSRPILPPTSLTATITDPFDGNVSLSWTAPAAGPEVAGYLVLRYDGADPLAGNAIPTTLAESATETTLVDSTVNAGSAYSYVVIALSADNMSEPAHSAAIEPPAAPTSLMAVAANGTIGLSWTTPDAGAIGTYRVERQPQDGQWAHLAETAETIHNDDAAADNATYAYRVQHRNDHGGSTWSTSEAVTLVVAPSAPTGVSATASGSDNIVSWTAPDSPFIDGYRVRHRTGDADWSILAGNVAADTITHTHQDAAADVTHHYAIQAHNSAGDGPWSDTATAGRITPPRAPQSVSAQLDGNDIVLSWERPDTVHVSGYTVRHQAGDADHVESERIPEGQTSLRMTEVAGDTRYRIAVRAHNDAGDGPWSDEVAVMRRLAPSAPTSFMVEVGEADIVLSWAAPDIGAADGYHVQYGIDGSDEAVTEELPAAQTSFTHSDNAQGVTYAYRVQAHNVAGQSPWSETITANRTLAPQAPTELMTVVNGALITVSWTPPASSIVDSYEIEQGVADSEETTPVNVDARQTSFDHIGAQGDVTHRYRVRSVNSAGHSPWTGPVEAIWIMPPGAPTNVSADTDSDDILISWNRPDSVFLDAYHVAQRRQNTEDWDTTVVAADQTSHRHVGPTPGTTYEYRVRAANAAGVSEWSPVVAAVRYDTAAPPAQFIYTAISDNRILVKWTPSLTPDIQRHQLRYNVDGGDWTEVNIPRRKPYHFASWTADQQYFEFQIRARKDGQYGDWSPIDRAYVSIPDAVTSLRANLESGSGVRLHWQHPASGIPHTYQVQRLQDDGSYADIGVAAGSQTTRSFLDTSGATSTYRVVAVNHAGLRGEHAESATATVTVAETIRVWPDMPQNLTTMMLDPGTVKLNWYPPAERARQVDAYRIYRKGADDNRALGASYRDHVLVALTGNANTHYIDHTAQPGVTHEYGVAAYWDGAYHPLGQISNRAYARPWE